MRKKIIIILAGIVLLGCSPSSAQMRYIWEKEKASPKVEKDINIRLPSDIPAPQQAYLGIGAASGTFLLSEINAQLVLIEIFDMYCPHCQKEAPEVNRLHELIEKEGLSEKIKLIGIGRDNSPYEVDTFRKKYDVVFPLFPDEGAVIAETLEYIATPYFLVVRLIPDAPPEVIMRHPGPLGSAGEFLENVREAGGL